MEMIFYLSYGQLVRLKYYFKTEEEVAKSIINQLSFFNITKKRQLKDSIRENREVYMRFYKQMLQLFEDELIKMEKNNSDLESVNKLTKKFTFSYTDALHIQAIVIAHASYVKNGIIHISDKKQLTALEELLKIFVGH